MANRQVNDKLYDSTIKLLEKNFGPGYNQRGLAEANPKAFPTGYDDLDDVLTKGARGVYRGGIIEILGSEGSGKTSLALRIVGLAQKDGLRCCWFDAEAAFDEYLAKLNGVDPTLLQLPDLADTKAQEAGDSLSFFNSNQVLEMLYRTIVSNVFDIVVLDSVAGLMPERVLSDEFDPNKAGVGEVARSMAQMLGKIAQACKKTETSVIFINQLRDQPGAYIQSRYHTPGGRALKFFAHQRISVEKMQGKDGRVYLDTADGPELIGHYARTVIVKNRKAPPVPEGMSIDIPIYYREYFPDDAKKCYDLARKLQVITIRNGVLTWKENNEIVLQKDGEASMLAEIREKKMESRLAAACVAAAQDERNAKLKNPVKVPSSIAELAARPVVIEKKEPKSTKRKNGPTDIE